jgi:hypothetical protein
MAANRTLAAISDPFAVSTITELTILIEYFSFYNGVPWIFRGETSLDFELVPA